MIFRPRPFFRKLPQPPSLSPALCNLATTANVLCTVIFPAQCVSLSFPPDPYFPTPTPSSYARASSCHAPSSILLFHPPPRFLTVLALPTPLKKERTLTNFLLPHLWCVARDLEFIFPTFHTPQSFRPFAEKERYVTHDPPPVPSFVSTLIHHIFKEKQNNQ